ncbi:MAG: pilus assembly protein PilV [Burkholderiales bacterium]
MSSFRGAGRRQRGSFLLEALIAILIVALGVLGSVGLLARSMQQVDDSRNRGEAAYLASWLIGQMWVTNRDTATLDATYGSSTAGTGYTDFKTMVQQRLPNAGDPVVTVGAGPIAATTTNSLVTVTITWTPPGETTPHQYNVTASIGANQ